MSTGARRPRREKAKAAPPPRRPELPGGTEVMIGRAQFAAAINRSPGRFDQLVNLRVVPPPDGTFQGDRFWLQSTVNRFIRSQTTTEQGADGRSV